jgi:alpha-glucosidase (family GH31 glycosyl hydrolase)
MTPSKLVFALVVGFCLLRPAPLLADDALSPFGANAQFSADMITTTKEGTSITQKLYSDSGKMRSEVTANGMNMVSIIRPDQKKVYSVMVDQKMAMEMPYDPEKMKQQGIGATGPQGKTELIGPDTVEGIACKKYKVTSEKDNKVFFFWADAANKTPVKMMAEDGALTIVWKNYKAGPQDAALFEVPAGYQVMQMPAAGGAAPAPPPAGP